MSDSASSQCSFDNCEKENNKKDKYKVKQIIFNFGSQFWFIKKNVFLEGKIYAIDDWLVLDIYLL